MARWISPLFAMLIGCSVVGCQSSQTSELPLPRPNFSGPVVQNNVTAAPVYVKPAPTYSNAAPKPMQSLAGIPASWIPTSPARDWTWIVIHHSATSVGGAKRFDIAHKAKGWDELGYHFVIGNGTDTADGLVEVGGRWPVQKHGAHAKTPDNKYNEHGIGICLVGNFDETRPTQKQMQSLVKLVAFLADRYKVSQSNILGHKMTGKQTDCPGNNVDIVAIRQMIAKARQVADAPDDAPTELVLDDSQELMQTAQK